jgi:putative alpha-1,2-mannosidase
VHLAGGDLTIVGSGAPAPYVRQLTLDGRAWPRPWLSWDDVAGGARLAFALAETPSPRWGSAPRHAPPSFGPRAALPR